MTDKKMQTESCTLCDKMNCEGCCLNETLSNNFNPNKQTQMMVADGFLDGIDLGLILQTTMKKRVCGIDE